jgi:hypothetical protein
MYCSIDIDTECRKILRQYQYPIKILKYFSAPISTFFPKHILLLNKTRTKHLKTIWKIKSLRIYPRIARKYLGYVSILQKQTKNILTKFGSLMSGVTTTTGNGIFVCYDDNQQQQLITL